MVFGRLFLDTEQQNSSDEPKEAKPSKPEMGRFVTEAIRGSGSAGCGLKRVLR